MDALPKWYRPVTIAALLWNLLGCAAYLADVLMTPEALAALPEAQRAMYEARPSWFVAAYAMLLASFAAILLAPALWLILVAQVAFGWAVGLIYYSSLYYSMDVGETKGEHGGIHEAAIGAGIFGGPAIGAGALYLFPAQPAAGVWAVGGLLVFRRISSFDSAGEAGLFSLLDRRVVEVLRQMPERHRYLRGLRSYVGFRSTTVQYQRPARDGRPRQSLAKLVRLAADGLCSFSYVPLRLSLFTGLLVSFLCITYAILLVVFRVLAWIMPSSVFDEIRVAGFTTIAVAILFLSGVQLIAVGIIGEYLGRVYEEVKRRPNYVIERTIGL